MAEIVYPNAGRVTIGGQGEHRDEPPGAGGHSEAFMSPLLPRCFEQVSQVPQGYNQASGGVDLKVGWLLGFNYAYKYSTAAPKA